MEKSKAKYQGIIPAFYEHSLYIGNLRKILDAPCKIEKDTGLTIPSDRPLTIEFDHVSFCYPFSEKLVLDDVCLCFTAGTKTAIVGHNGAGKTTIIKLLLRLYDVDAGEIPCLFRTFCFLVRISRRKMRLELPVYWNMLG